MKCLRCGYKMKYDPFPKQYFCYHCGAITHFPIGYINKKRREEELEKKHNKLFNL